jgi:hypothetical protein
MNVHEVAGKIRETGISQDTVIIVYHKTLFDLRLLRDFLESGGYFDLLPPETQCIPMVNILRPNLTSRLPDGRPLPLSLEVLFPLMYLRHRLIGLNHQALVDCQQTRLVCMAYDELCRPLADRPQRWESDMIATTAQQSILDWLQRAPQGTISDANDI